MTYNVYNNEEQLKVAIHEVLAIAGNTQAELQKIALSLVIQLDTKKGAMAQINYLITNFPKSLRKVSMLLYFSKFAKCDYDVAGKKLVYNPDKTSLIEQADKKAWFTCAPDEKMPEAFILEEKLTAFIASVERRQEKPKEGDAIPSSQLDALRMLLQKITAENSVYNGTNSEVVPVVQSEAIKQAKQAKKAA